MKVVHFCLCFILYEAVPRIKSTPAGDGTGLGLSLSYDIITKEHSGTIEVATAEGEYAEFILRLPV